MSDGVPSLGRSDGVAESANDLKAVSKKERVQLSWRGNPAVLTCQLGTLADDGASQLDWH